MKPSTWILFFGIILIIAEIFLEATQKEFKEVPPSYFLMGVLIILLGLLVKTWGFLIGIE